MMKEVFLVLDIIRKLCLITKLNENALTMTTDATTMQIIINLKTITVSIVNEIQRKKTYIIKLK